MAAQATAKQKEAEALLQAKIDADLEKRAVGLVVLPPPSPAKQKTKTPKTADVAPDYDGVSQASGASKGTKRRRKQCHAERATEVEDLSHRLRVFEESFEKVATSASAKKPSGYSSEDDTRPHKSPDSELRSIVLAVQRGLRKTRTTLESKKKDDLANKVCALLTKDGDAGLYTPIKPRKSPRRMSPSSVGSMASGHPGPTGTWVHRGVIRTKECFQRTLGFIW